MEVTERLVAPPGKETVACANCGEELFVDEGVAGPHLCEACDLAPGEPVIDRETGDLLIVVRTTGRRADEVTVPDRDVTVDEYPTNEGYRADDVVVEAMYPVPAGLGPDEFRPSHVRHYSFPRGRLARREAVGDDQSELSEFGTVEKRGE